MSKFSDTLKKLRTKKGYTQKQLADLVGVSESAIGMYERGMREPNFEMLETIADIFNVYMSDLIEEKADSPYITYKRGKFQPLRLKQYRLSVQESPEDVASKLGVSKHSYLGWEDGSITMFVEQIEEVAEYFGISTDYLYGYTDDPKAGMKKSSVLSFEEQRIGYLYGRADADTQKAVELMLKRFDNEDIEQEETVRVFRAAHTDDRSVPAEYIDMPKSRLQKIKDAPEATDENL